MSTFTPPTQDRGQIAAKAREHLEAVVRIDSSSDESSQSIPSTPGQKVLADWLGEFFTKHGATIERDDHANVIATFAGRGALADAEPLALLVHLDTARGTHPVDGLIVHPGWNGERLSYPKNPGLDVSLANYPSLQVFMGQDVLHGPGDAPFGLDDKLGMTHMMTLAWLLHTNPSLPHPPLLLIARPDEEIGRMEALVGLADMLAARGVRSGYTIDGLEPFEINVENFNAAQGSVWFEHGALDLQGGHWVDLFIGGVNTHGATAKAEGHRPATRLAAEIFDQLASNNGVTPATFASDALRDCDARILVHVQSTDDHKALEDAVKAVVGPHIPRGASYSLNAATAPASPTSAVQAALQLILRFLNSNPGFELAAEDSEHYQGYSQPYRILADGDALRLDVRIRDFKPEGIQARQDHLTTVVDGAHKLSFQHQYVNMGPKLAERPDLVERALQAGQCQDIASRVLPIRGGTGVDPFLDKGIAVANLGTGYFAPESEKEFTSLQSMASHALWLLALCTA